MFAVDAVVARRYNGCYNMFFSKLLNSFVRFFLVSRWGIPWFE